MDIVVHSCSPGCLCWDPRDELFKRTTERTDGSRTSHSGCWDAGSSPWSQRTGDSLDVRSPLPGADWIKVVQERDAHERRGRCRIKGERLKFQTRFKSRLNTTRRSAGAVHHALSTGGEGSAGSREGSATPEANRGTEWSSCGSGSAAGETPSRPAEESGIDEALLYSFSATRPTGASQRRSNRCHQSRKVTSQAREGSIKWRSSLSSVKQRYWDDLATERDRQRSREDHERRGEIAFLFPIFWTCWRSQCRLAYHKS